MSLLIDALKKAEMAKKKQQELETEVLPVVENQSTIEEIEKPNTQSANDSDDDQGPLTLLENDNIIIEKTPENHSPEDLHQNPSALTLVKQEDLPKEEANIHSDKKAKIDVHYTKLEQIINQNAEGHTGIETQQNENENEPEDGHVESEFSQNSLPIEQSSVPEENLSNSDNNPKLSPEMQQKLQSILKEVKTGKSANITEEKSTVTEFSKSHIEPSSESKFDNKHQEPLEEQISDIELFTDLQQPSRMQQTKQSTVPEFNQFRQYSKSSPKITTRTKILLTIALLLLITMAAAYYYINQQLQSNYPDPIIHQSLPATPSATSNQAKTTVPASSAKSELASKLKPVVDNKLKTGVAAVKKQPQTTTPEKISTKRVTKNQTALPKKAASPSAEESLFNRLTQAYNAVQLKNYAEAREKYESILQQHSNNKDALLGLAAISIADGRTDLAADYYQQILDHNANDAIAQAGLINSIGNMNTLDAESRLKTLINNNSSAAYLHFTLGNIFVNQQRWADAEQSFSAAFTLDSSNADYAYNLAVSKDMLSNSSAAADYYSLALTLSSSGDHSFNRDQVETRLQQIL